MRIFNSSNVLSKLFRKLILVVLISGLFMAPGVKAAILEDLTYKLSETIQLHFKLIKNENNPEGTIEVSLSNQSGKVLIFQEKIENVMTPIFSLPMPIEQKTHIKNNTYFNHTELNDFLKEQGLFAFRISKNQADSELIVIPVYENIKEIGEKKPLSLFKITDSAKYRKFKYTRYFLRLVRPAELIEKNISVSPYLLFSAIDHNIPSVDLSSKSSRTTDYQHKGISLYSPEGSNSKGIVVSEDFFPFDQIGKYQVATSYSKANSELLLKISEPHGSYQKWTVSAKSEWLQNEKMNFKLHDGDKLEWFSLIRGSVEPDFTNSNFANKTDSFAMKKMSSVAWTNLNNDSLTKQTVTVQPASKSSAKSAVKTSSDEVILDNYLQRPTGIAGINEYLQLLEKTVNSMVSGQPEAVSVLKNIELNDIRSDSNRSKPEVAWLAGLPGTGKDTLVEAYVITKQKLLRPNDKADPENHIFRLPKLKEEKDIWSLTGSGTGYKGSDSLSPLVRWLVLHSGGKYIIKDGADENTGSNKKPAPEVHLNPEWRPGQVLDGYYGPDEAVLFANELHDWSKEMINKFLKEALEKGFFNIGNPGNGLAQIKVPVNIFIASNHGIGKIAARDAEGKRVGAPLSYDSLMERWKNSVENVDDLLTEISSTTPGNKEGGCSEEILSRIPKSRFILLRPLSKKALELIAKMKLNKKVKMYSQDKTNGFPKINFKFDSSVLDFLSSYDQIAEEGARKLDDKIDTLIDKTLLEAIMSGQIKHEAKKNLEVGIVKNQDGTYSLLVDKTNLIIKGTIKEKASQAISDSKIDSLNDLENKLNARVKGVSHIIKELVRDVRRSENSFKSNVLELNTKVADVYMFLGSSSTGKTELAVSLHQELYKDSSKPLVIDFGQVRTIEDLKSRILGGRSLDSNKSVPSDFMQEYDRRNGDMVVVFDEIANANPEVLKALYDLLREPIVNTFSDKKPRPMGRVKIVMTGNAGEEWYQGIPRDIPEIQQYEAARKIYESSKDNDGFKRGFLMKKFSEAFLNRVTMSRIYFFGPHTNTTTRELIQFKLVKALENFNKVKDGIRTWDVRFATQQDYAQTIEAIEKFGFKIWEQGASITHFIDNQLLNEIHDELLKRKIPAGTKVLIKKVSDKALAGKEQSSSVNFELQIPNQKESIMVSVRGKTLAPAMKQNRNDFILTAFHEAGHAFLSRALLGDKIKSAGVSIIPGVAEIDGEWIRYEGVASSFQVEKMSITREALISRIAVLLGGGVAEALATKNYKLTAGHQNDLQRATKIATGMVIDYGLSDWQGIARQEGQSVESFLNSLTSPQRSKVVKAVDQVLKEARTLAEKMLSSHFESFIIPLTKHLVAKGEIKGDVMNRFFQMKEFELLSSYDDVLIKKGINKFKKLVAQDSEITSKTARRDFEFHDFMKTEAYGVYDLDAKLQEKFNKEVALVDLSLGKKVIDDSLSFKESLKKRSSSANFCLKYYK